MAAHDAVESVPTIAWNRRPSSVEYAAKLAELQSGLGQIAGMQVATLATSLAGIGVTVAATGVLLRRMESLRQGVADLGDRIDRDLSELRSDWRRTEIDGILELAANKAGRIEQASDRRNPTAMLEDAETELHICFDRLANRLERLQGDRRVPGEDLVLLVGGLAISGGAHVRALFLLDEPASARQAAEEQRKRLVRLARVMPPDRLTAERPHEDPALHAALAANLIETGRRVAGIPPLVDALTAQGISPREWLRMADFCTDVLTRAA